MDYGPILDWWILPHFCFFLFLASSIHAKWEPVWWEHIILCVMLSIAWEVPEYFLQRKYIETWVVVEHPVNSWVIDPISNGAGWFVGTLIGAWSKSRKRYSPSNRHLK